MDDNIKNDNIIDNEKETKKKNKIKNGSQSVKVKAGEQFKYRRWITLKITKEQFRDLQHGLEIEIDKDHFDESCMEVCNGDK